MIKFKCAYRYKQLHTSVFHTKLAKAVNCVYNREREDPSRLIMMHGITVWIGCSCVLLTMCVVVNRLEHVVYGTA